MSETLGEMPYQSMRDSQKLSIVLHNEGDLDQTGYKVLHSVAGAQLLCGFKSLYNGKVKLTYDISQCTPLPALIGSLSAGQTLNALCGMLNILEQIYDIGFLQYENISLEQEDIFLDSTTYQVYLIYIPVKTGRDTMSRSEFELKFRTCLCSILAASPVATQLETLEQAVSSGCVLSEIRDKLRGGEFVPKTSLTQLTEPVHEPPKPIGVGGWLKGLMRRSGERQAEPPPAQALSWHLWGVGTPEPVDLLLAGDNFVIGRSGQSAQGCIEFNRTIGREHCRFCVCGAQCFIEDLDSHNGTYLNDVRLIARKRYEVFPGDRVKLSNTEFELRKQ